jgi:hypothetical protein
VLDSNGRPASPIWLLGGISHKFVLAPSNDTDPPTSALYTWDTITGINDKAFTQDQWTDGPTPTYVSTSSFTLVGDQTSTFQPGRRIKATVTAGTVYGFILSSTFSSVTTVVLESAVLDSGLSAVAYGLVSSGSSGLPILPLRTWLAGLTLSNNVSDATNDIDIAAGECADSTNTFLLKLTSSITKRLDAAWAVGTNQGGLDTGAIANGVYHKWLIERSDTGVVDALFSLSATAPTMPTSYDRKKRLGGIIRAGGTILPFTQFKDNFLLTTPVRDINVTNPGNTAQTRTLASIITGVRVRAYLHVATFDTGALESVYVSDLNATDQAPSQTASPLHSNRSQVANDTGANPMSVLTNTSGQIRTRNSAGGVNCTLIIVTLGWDDYRID